MPTHYTDEILDSMLSLSRFTSLVRWKDAKELYRPVRVTGLSGGTSITLKNAYGQPLSENDWLWTAASDTTVTVGWIVRRINFNYNVPECDNPTTLVAPPVLYIRNLSPRPLELAWFDDHKGCLIGSRTTSTSGSFSVQAPNTESGPPAGFGKSVAFVIQPVGWTPNAVFEQLPNSGDTVGQIVVSKVTADILYHDEHPQMLNYGTVRFTAWTKPVISNPGQHDYVWNWTYRYPQGYPNPPTKPTDQGLGKVVTDQTFSSVDQGIWEVTLDVNDLQGRRVSGDKIYLRVVY